MSFPRYPAYKPSGVEWLGEVPEHWEVTKLGRICKFESGKAHEPFIDDDGEFICVNSRFISTEGKTVKNCRENLSPALRNDVLAVMSDLPNGRALGKAFFVEEDQIYAVNQRVCRLIPVNVTPRLLFWLVNRNPGLLWFDDGVNQTHIPNSGFTKLVIALPGNGEQGLIATFLDRETAKIDALIAEQQRLIELLQEKRQAVISHAVTKGLNPDAPMKDSGVEWLGEVPEHWAVWKTSQLLNGIGSGTTPKSDTIEFYEDGAIPWVVTGDLNDSLLCACQNRITEKAMAEHTTLKLYPAGSVAVAMYGATIGKASVLDFEATVNQACCVLPPSRLILGKYLLGFILAAREHLLSVATGGGQPNINQDIIRSLRVPLPSLDEQFVIVGHIENVTGEVDSLLDMSNQQIHLLQERRSALISAAVTGQIDVRGLVPEAEAA
ncbi:restriction endonuclease subunit S [Cyanobium sp. FGCU-6]|jgi:type I restriction enzyme S subunit|nr:restriction endonuclease subunit S [Cyanobium sp. FGCU6]